MFTVSNIPITLYLSDHKISLSPIAHIARLFCKKLGSSNTSHIS